MQIDNYWFATGTPTYLVELMKQHNYNVEEIEDIVTSGPVLDSIDSASTDPVPVIYQSGYLTIKDYNEEFENYTLGFPNREVEQGFFRFLLPNYASVSVTKSPYEIQRFVTDVRKGDVSSLWVSIRKWNTIHRVDELTLCLKPPTISMSWNSNLTEQLRRQWLR